MEREPPFPLYVFDAYGTLFDVHSAVARHRDLAGPRPIAFQKSGAQNNSNIPGRAR